MARLPSVEPAMLGSNVLSRLTAVLILIGSLNAFLDRVPAQEPAAETDRPALSAEERKELDDLLTLTVQQQIQRARELIEEHPDTELARILQRLLDEHEAFQYVKREEQRLREARSEWARAYWRDRCCPMPPWHPPVGRIVNETSEPVLYEQRLDGIHTSRWAGPYFLAVGRDHASPHPYLVRYLVAGDLRTSMILPGENYAFRGSARDGTLVLTPAGSPPALPGDSLVVPPLPVTSDAVPEVSEDLEPTPETPPAASTIDGPTIEGPMIAP